MHAPRQTGKTTTLRALARELTEGGRFAAVHFSCERSEAAGDDYRAAQEGVLDSIREEAEIAFDDPALCPPSPWPEAGDVSLLTAGLAAWSRACPRPLVLFFDEIDALRGESLVAVLRQPRGGYPRRPETFPWSVGLCGLRDVREYEAKSGGDAGRLGTSSPFNIKVESLRVGDFTPEEVRALLAQHTEATGRTFAEEALARICELTQGQPWLVNALAREVVERTAGPATAAVTAARVDEAKERLILARATHLDSLVARLSEPRIRRIVEPLLAGDDAAPEEGAGAGAGAGDGGGAGGTDPLEDDFLYVRDLGLVAPTLPLRIANPIYREVIPRVLAFEAEARVTAEPQRFVLPDGRLDLRRLLEEFGAFWVQHGDVLAGRMPYREVAPQLVLMAFLQRVVNGGGFVEREYGIGRGRIDLCIRWPLPPARDGAGGRGLVRRGVRSGPAWQREALELKVRRDGRPDPLEEGLVQLEAYVAGLGLDRGVLVIFDRRTAAPPLPDRVRFEEATTPGRGFPVTVMRA